jgi:hypothetical protein
MSENNTKQLPVKVILSVKVDGKEVFQKEDDLLTKWFNRYLAVFISNISLNLKDLNGSEFGMWLGTFSTTYFSNLIAFSKIAIGLDPTDPSPTDYNLKNTYMSTSTLSTRLVQETDNYLMIDTSANFTFTEDKTVYEFGLIGKAPASGAAYREFLMARDVVPDGVYVSNGQVLTITYRFIIGTYP